MTRSLLVLALAFSATAASAQSPADPDPGYFVGVEDVTISASTFADFDAVGTRAVVGRRFGNGVEVGLLGAYSRYDRGSVDSYQWQAGLTGGLTRPGPRGTTLRLRGLVSLNAGESTFSGGSVAGSSLDGDLSATLGREVPVVGSVRVEPMVGAYAHLTDPMHRSGTGSFSDLPPGRISTEAGLQFQLPIRFRALGLDASLTPGLRLTTSDLGREAPLPRRSFLSVPGTGFRIDF